MKRFGFFYNLAVHLFALGMLPKVVFAWKKYRKNLLARLGKGFPNVNKEGHKLIWVHAVSFGETKAIAPLIKKLKKEEPAYKILLSSTTETGYQEGLKNISEADWHTYLPFDLPYIIRPIVKKISPDTLILTETDFWYNFQDAAKACGAKIIVVNGKLSEKSFNRYVKFSSFARHLLKPIDCFFLQGDLYKKRLEKLSIEPSKLVVTGNIKLDGMELKHTPSNEPILTIGSTHAPEEDLWLSALKTIWKSFPDLKVMLVPRHPERFDEVAKLIEKHGVTYGRHSKGDTLEKYNLLLIDAMGLLRSLYAKSSLAFVGGSFVEKIGGHNILEPCFYGKPVLFGPYMHSQPDFLDLMHAFEAGIQLTESSIVPTVERLLSNPKECVRLGENGLKLVRSSQGALDKTLKQLRNIMAS